MEKVNYEKISEFVEGLRQNHIYFDTVVNNDSDRKEILMEFLSKDKVERINNISDFNYYDFNDIRIVNYITSIIDDNNNFIISNKRVPNVVLEVSKSSKIGVKNSGIRFDEYFVYDVDKKISLSIKKSSKYYLGNLIQEQVTTTEKNRNSSVGYIIRHYDFTYQDGKCCFLKIDNDIVLDGMNSFNAKLIVAKNHISDLENKFCNYFENITSLGAKTKVYEIKRKYKQEQ